ncbi:MAG: hypothetical protein HFJ23_08485 [Clostridia bacterium]|nr:hypothetical protein [Clostridia bacterium]
MEWIRLLQINAMRARIVKENIVKVDYTYRTCAGCSGTGKVNCSECTNGTVICSICRW